VIQSTGNGADVLQQLRYAYRSLRDAQELLENVRESLQKQNYGTAEGWLNSLELKIESTLEQVETSGKAKVRDDQAKK
jgi:hypothetical protein